MIFFFYALMVQSMTINLWTDNLSKVPNFSEKVCPNSKPIYSDSKL